MSPATGKFSLASVRAPCQARRMRNAKLSKVARMAFAIVLPILTLALTGRVLDDYSAGTKKSRKGYGWLVLKYDSTGDHAYPTQWRVVDGYEPSDFDHVRGRHSTLGQIELYATRYLVQFQMTDRNSPHTPPPDVRVDVAPGKLTTYYITYKPKP